MTRFGGITRKPAVLLLRIGVTTIRPLSYTQISLYQSCPLLYKLQYIDGLKPKDKWYFSFGSTMHRCVEYFFKVMVPPPLDKLLQFYQQNWLSEGYESAEEEKSYRAYGQEILTKFWGIHSAEFHMPLAVEKLFYVDIGGVKLRGYIDRVDKLESGGLSIIDYKTNRELFTTDYLENDLQLTLYQIAAEQMWQLPVECLTLYHLRSNTPCSCSPRNETALRQARQVVTEIAENIARGDFPATENPYCPCDFPEYCPYYQHKYLVEAAAATARQDLLPGIEAGEAVERYYNLQAQIKELSRQLDEAKQEIVSFCQSQGLNRVFGSEHAATYKLVEKTGFSEEEVRAVLEPEGLWQRVLSLDQSKLGQLIKDEAVASDIRKNVEALRRIVYTYPRLFVEQLAEEE